MQSVRVSLLGRIVVTCLEQGGAGRHPASDETSNPLGHPASDETSNPHVGRGKVGRASRARLPGILPGSDGDNATRIAPLAMQSVRVS
ncbi:MAG: hypothetical protein WBX15_14735, partial [Thermoanaerobaculia bacterium]